MKIHIICNSKTGFTKQYADWISEEIGGSVQQYKGFSEAVINADDLVIFGSRLHAGKIEYLSKVKARLQNHRNFIVYTVGGVPGNVTEAVDKIWAGNFTEEELARIPRFYMQGGINYEKMGFLDRTMMKTAAKVMNRQNDMNAADKAFAKSIQNSYDISSREYIRPLVDYVRETYL